MPETRPPLTALRAFEAAARHMSFQDAAEELGVTPAALSYQIKNLEAHLGAPLFYRRNRAVSLTEAGRALAPAMTSGFDTLHRGWRAVQRLQDSTTLVVTAGPAFTAKWLAPRLYKFAERHPEIELRFAATLKIMDFDRDAVDVAIRFGTGTDDGFFSEPVYAGWISPMMRPEIAARVATPGDLLNETLIHDDSLTFLPRSPDWDVWLRQAGVALPDAPLRGPRFSQADHAIDLALEGVGVVMGRSSIALNLLRAGTLIAPFPLALTVDAMYRLVCPHGQETRPAVAAFRDWIHAEMAPDLACHKGRQLVHIG